MATGSGRADESLFAWMVDEDSQMFKLTPSQELVQKLVRNHMANIKVTKHSLFSARGLLEFSNSEWVKVLQGKAVDHDVMFSGIHSTISNNQASEMFRNFEFRFGHAKPAKSVRSHVEWLIIMFSTF